MILMHEGEDEIEELEEELEGAIEVSTPMETALSHTSLYGLDSPKTLKILGEVQGRKVVILIDCGASHTFLHPRLAEELGLRITKRQFFVTLGDGKRVQGHGVCHHVQAGIQNAQFVFPQCFLLDLGDIDVILGVDWLSSLGEIKSNWKTPSMRFKWKGQKIRLEGNPALLKKQASIQSMRKELQAGGEGFLLQYVQLDEEEAPPETREAVIKLLCEFDQLFQDPIGLPPQRVSDHAIRLKEGSQPPRIRPYRYPHVQKNEIERLVSEMQAAGIIRSIISPYSSPVLLVRKKDGGWRFCVDYRALNELTIPDKFLIPAIDELLDELGGAQIFSKLDLKSGYHHIRVIEDDIEKTAFRTHSGHYEFAVMPFGLTNAPATFQALMNEVFRNFLRKFILVFFDDILVFSKSMTEHLEHLRTTFLLLSQHQLVVNKKKCLFGASQLSYLGHIISDQGVSADPEKIIAMTNWPIPQNVRALRGFLGLTGYYRRFVQGYGKIAAPLTTLLRKDNFCWGDEALAAFEKLKTAMTTVPVLVLPDFSKEFVVETDASGGGLGAVLMQEGRPIAYWSQALSLRAKSKSVYEKELMAIVFALQKWRHYLLGRRFKVRTDHKALRFLLEQRELAEGQQKWMMKLLGYTFDIIYKPGVENGAADALSRKHEAECALAHLSVNQWLDGDKIQDEVQQHAKFRAIIQDLLLGSQTHSHYQLRNGILYYKGRLVLVENSMFIPTILVEFHATPASGHSGFLRTYKRISAVAYWIGMKNRIKEFVSACDICQRNKSSSMKPAGLLQPLPIPSQIWEDLSMDFIGGLPKTKKGDTILVVVDRLSKAAHFMCLTHPYTAKEVAMVFCSEVVRLHGIPKSIVSDRDQIFLSQFWSELFLLSKTSLKYSSAYHPQSDGQTEVVNRSVETYLRCFCSRQPKDWPHWLCWAEFWYNTTYQGSAKMTPFKVVYGRDPPSLIRYEAEGTKVEEVDIYLTERDRILEDLKANLVIAQNKMKQLADGHRRELEFQVGEETLLKIQPYRFKKLAKRPNEKLSPRFYGPFKVLEKIGQVAYKLDLPAGSKVHPVFHVSQLKKVVGSMQIFQPLPRCLEADWELTLTPEELLAYRYSSEGTLQVLIQWKSLPTCENTWEDFEEMAANFPDFYLEDKVKLKGGDVDRTLIKKVYTRRRRLETRGLQLQRITLDEEHWENIWTRGILRENGGGVCYAEHTFKVLHEERGGTEV